MVDQADKLVKPGGTILILLLTLAFYCFMTKVLMSHVPSEIKSTQLLFAAFGAFPLGACFWLASEFFRVTLVDQIRRKRAGEK